MTEDEMVGWHHQLDGHGDGQGGLTCYSPRGCKELDTTERLNRTQAKGNSQVSGPTVWSGAVQDRGGTLSAFALAF